VSRILLVRHGQSEWNADGRWQGQENPPLTEIGRQQARQAARAVGSIDAVFASPLARAAESAEIIADELGIGPVITLPGLMERHAGTWQGLTRAEIEDEYPGYLADGRRPPGWEDDKVVEERILGALDKIAAAHPHGHTLVVSHAGAIFAVEAHHGGEWERLANLSGRWFEHVDHWSMGPRVHLLIEETIPDQI